MPLLHLAASGNACNPSSAGIGAFPDTTSTGSRAQGFRSKWVPAERADSLAWLRLGAPVRSLKKLKSLSNVSNDHRTVALYRLHAHRISAGQDGVEQINPRTYLTEDVSSDNKLCGTVRCVLAPRHIIAVSSGNGL